MFLSRFQLQEALRLLDEARSRPCQVPRRTDVQEKWDDQGRFVTAKNPDPEFFEAAEDAARKGRERKRTNADPLPNPHGRAFQIVDPETGEVRCAACEAQRGGR